MLQRLTYHYKTTIANEIAYSFDRSHTPYSFFELDTQGGSVHKEMLDPDAIVQIADTPAANEGEMPKWARAADVVIIPVRSSTLDAHAFVSTLMAVRESNPKAAIIIVQNGWNRFRAAREFEDWLKEKAPDVDIFPLSQSDMFVQAAALKQSVRDRAPRSRAAEQMQDIVIAVRKAADMDYETV